MPIPSKREQHMVAFRQGSKLRGETASRPGRKNPWALRLIYLEVNLIFRLEKLAGSLRQQSTISASANSKLGSSIATRSLGNHRLKGFDDTYEIFAI